MPTAAGDAWGFAEGDAAANGDDASATADDGDAAADGWGFAAGATVAGETDATGAIAGGGVGGAAAAGADVAGGAAPPPHAAISPLPPAVNATPTVSRKRRRESCITASVKI
ncbi:MAG: hypothetical protein E6I52_18535 [Chloroflexi bacterium]|nr:MAG: hypothetical protein E6I52_18535 [Chloroflexota bacterium]